MLIRLAAEKGSFLFGMAYFSKLTATSCLEYNHKEIKWSDLGVGSFDTCIRQRWVIDACGG